MQTPRMWPMLPSPRGSSQHHGGGGSLAPEMHVISMRGTTKQGPKIRLDSPNSFSRVGCHPIGQPAAVHSSTLGGTNLLTLPAGQSRNFLVQRSEKEGYKNGQIVECWRVFISNLWLKSPNAGWCWTFSATSHVKPERLDGWIPSPCLSGVCTRLRRTP